MRHSKGIRRRLPLEDVFALPASLGALRRHVAESAVPVLSGGWATGPAHAEAPLVFGDGQRLYRCLRSFSDGGKFQVAAGPTPGNCFTACTGPQLSSLATTFR